MTASHTTTVDSTGERSSDADLGVAVRSRGAPSFSVACLPGFSALGRGCIRLLGGPRISRTKWCSRNLYGRVGSPVLVVGVPAMRRQCRSTRQRRGGHGRVTAQERDAPGASWRPSPRPSLWPGTGAVTALARCSGALWEHTKGVVTRVGRDHQLPVTEIDRGTASGRDMGPHYEVLFALGGNLRGAAVGGGRLCDQPLCDTLHYRGLTAAGVSSIR